MKKEVDTHGLSSASRTCTLACPGVPPELAGSTVVGDETDDAGENASGEGSLDPWDVDPARSRLGRLLRRAMSLSA